MTVFFMRNAGYGEKTVLNGVDFYAHPKEISVILGGSGCGKSTLLRHILGLYRPKEGTIKLFGQELTDMTRLQLKKARSNIGVLFQNSALFTSMTVGENIALVIRENTDLPEEIIQHIARMKLSQVDLSEAIDKYPDELSGGMKKRAALARAIAFDPKILFCDEPSAGLDPIVATELDDLLINLKQLMNMTIIVVTHELESIKKIADKVTMLHQGSVIASGSLAEVMNHDDPFVSAFFHRRPFDDVTEHESIYALMKGKTSDNKS